MSTSPVQHLLLILYQRRWAFATFVLTLLLLALLTCSFPLATLAYAVESPIFLESLLAVECGAWAQRLPVTWQLANRRLIVHLYTLYDNHPDIVKIPKQRLAIWHTRMIESGNPTSNQVLLAALKRIRIEHVLDLHISPGSAQCQLFRTNTQTFNAVWQHVRCEHVRRQHRITYAIHTTWPKSTSSRAVSAAKL
jgi:hypothetical protein